MDSYPTRSGGDLGLFRGRWGKKTLLTQGRWDQVGIHSMTFYQF